MENKQKKKEKEIVSENDLSYACGYHNGLRDGKAICKLYDNMGEKLMDELAINYKKMGDFNFNTDFQLGWTNCFAMVKKFVEEKRDETK